MLNDRSPYLTPLTELLYIISTLNKKITKKKQQEAIFLISFWCLCQGVTTTKRYKKKEDSKEAFITKSDLILFIL